MKKPKISNPSRRQVLAGSAALAGAGLLAGCGNEQGLKIKDILGAEKLAGVEYTEAERQQLLETLEDHLDRLRSLRALKQPNTLAPATTFDPRLPNKDFWDFNDSKPHYKSLNIKLPGREEDIAFAPVSHLLHWIMSRQISSVNLTKIYLSRIKRFAPKLECFVTVTEELALKQAREMDELLARGLRKGLLHGIPYALKDLFDTKDIKTTWGAAPYQNRVAEKDAWIVNRLRDAGAVLLGKTTCGAIAYGDIWFGGKTRNPWNTLEGSSGSSAGSASATAAGLCGFSIGTETLGSIVSPSNRCGTTGLRPTFGRVSRTGAMALCWSLDKVGPICRTAEDCLSVLTEINGQDFEDASSLYMGFDFSEKPLAEYVVGFDPRWFQGENVNPADLKAFQTLKSLGVKTREIQIPERPYGALITILMAEAAAAFEELTEDNLDDQMVWQDKNAWPNGWREARFIPAIDMLNADRLRRTIMEDMDQIFDGVDLIAGPNFAGNMLTITNYTGHPQLTLRGGFYETPIRGLFGEGEENPKPFRVPRNFSLWAPLFQEGRLVQVGRALEQALGIWKERPPGF